MKLLVSRAGLLHRDGTLADVSTRSVDSGTTENKKLPNGLNLWGPGAPQGSDPDVIEIEHPPKQLFIKTVHSNHSRSALEEVSAGNVNQATSDSGADASQISSIGFQESERIPVPGLE